MCVCIFKHTSVTECCLGHDCSVYWYHNAPKLLLWDSAAADLKQLSTNLTLKMKRCCFSVQVIFRYLCEEGHHVISEKQFFPAVRELVTKLILSGKTKSGRN